MEDETDTATFLAFGKIAEKLTDTTVDTISLLGKTNRYNVPDFLKNLLVGKTVIFNVTAMKKSNTLRTFVSESTQLAYLTSSHHRPLSYSYQDHLLHRVHHNHKTSQLREKRSKKSPRPI